ncbi:MAG: hypothetical protein JW808_04555 [Victivallales bacterium]|nr:hypothetical protein [Victivallales bacterium]
MELPPIQKRARLLLFFLFLWAALVAAHLFYYSVWDRHDPLQKGKLLSEKIGVIPARRGRILDSDMHPLAWSERHFDLILSTSPEIPGRRKRMLLKLGNIFPDIRLPENDTEECIREGITPLQQIECFELSRSFPELDLRSRVSRAGTGIPAIERMIGETATRNESLFGVSGLEKQHNEHLRGTNGYYKVMANRFGRWIPGTWQEISPPRHGKDLVLEISVAEIIKGTNHE